MKADRFALVLTMVAVLACVSGALFKHKVWPKIDRYIKEVSVGP